MTAIRRVKCPRCKGVCAVQEAAPAPDAAVKKPASPVFIVCPYCAASFDAAGL